MSDWNDYWEPGQWWGSPQVYGACQSGLGLWTDGWKEGIKVLSKGDKISVICAEREQHYTVTSDVVPTTGGLAFIPISPDVTALIPTGTISGECLPDGALVSIPGRVA